MESCATLGKLIIFTRNLYGREVVMSVKVEIIDLCKSRPRPTYMISFSRRVEHRDDPLQWQFKSLSLETKETNRTHTLQPSYLNVILDVFIRLTLAIFLSIFLGVFLNVFLTFLQMSF